MTRRTVNLVVSEKFYETINGKSVRRIKTDAAIGYLTMWGLEGYDTLDLLLEDSGNMSALYTDKKSGRQFQMAGILSGEHDTASYSFHS